MTKEEKEVAAAEKRLDWLKERQKGIGGSDVAAILGVNPYKTPLDVYYEKTAEIVEDKPQSDAAFWGSTLEDIVAKEFAARTGMKVQRLNSSLGVSFYERIPKASAAAWGRANIDRAIVNPAISKTVRVTEGCGSALYAKCVELGLRITTDTILECKTANARLADHWGPSQEAEIIAGNVTSEHKIPIYYETQVQWYLGVTGAKTCYVAVLIGGSDFRIYKVDRDEALIQAIVEKCWAFWHDNVLARVPPAPINADDVKKLYEKDNGEMLEASNEVATTIGELRTVKAQMKELEEQKKALEADLILAIGEAQGFTIGGQKAVTYKAQSSTRFDSTRFKAERPELYKQYAKTSSTRVLRI